MGKISKAADAAARPGLYGTAGLLATKLYEGYSALVESPVTDVVGNAVGKADTVVGTAGGLHDAASVVSDTVGDIPIASHILGNFAVRVSDAIPTTGSEILTTAALTFAGCAMLRSAQKCAREPVESLQRLRQYSQSDHRKLSWEGIKTFTGGLWDRIWHAPVYAPFVPLAAWACDVVEPLRKPAGDVGAQITESAYALWTASAAPEELVNCASGCSEFLVKYALPIWVAYKGWNYVVNKYEDIVHEVVDCFRSRRTERLPGAGGRNLAPY
jgi:hypothetical protein